MIILFSGILYFYFNLTLKKIMKVLPTLKNIVHNGGNMFLPSVSVDCVIFGFYGNELKILLLKMKHNDVFGFPGGFILKDENATTAAERVLKERTGLNNIILTQFHTFSEPKRSDKKLHLSTIKKEGLSLLKGNWLLQRFVTIGYYALVDFTKVLHTHDALSETCDWYPLQPAPVLMMDHNDILSKALQTLQQQINHQPIGYNLLPPKFTMPELQKLYETILDKALDRRNFQRRMLSYGILKKLEEVKTGVAHKAPFLYSFNKQKYEEAVRDGLGGGW